MLEALCHFAAQTPDKIALIQSTAQGEVRFSYEALLARVLPAAMIPTDYRHYDQLPRTGSNKLDRKALLAAYQAGGEALTLGSETENRVGAIWQQILGLATMAPTDNFFELGASPCRPSRSSTGSAPSSGCRSRFPMCSITRAWMTSAVSSTACLPRTKRAWRWCGDV